MTLQYFSTIKDKEVALHRPEIRSDLTQLVRLIHPSFIEVGYSGKVYDFESITQSLTQQPESDYQIVASEFEYKELSPSVILLIYKTERIDNAGNISRQAMRSSIWIREAGNW
ncbi:nuclear transport factor 2 family protein [Aliikangiella marina]|uniref:Nuclear transport factor 2 family protein n=1 Tax=Aliikangiella marina TaxID=1712262 RepID=A0A545TED7_9GAMM|nr:nuclear transport factor 2 family protein [Aliikangiella marina]TQV75536.1 nuclear transport factor 2 family protein [Aliikangiella marina]